MKKKKTKPGLFQQLAFEFPEAVVHGPAENVTLLNPANRVFESVATRGQYSESRFTSFLRKYVPELSFLLDCFDNMEEAEDQLYMGYGRYPDRAQVIDRVFPALYSTQVIRTAGYNTYLAHIRELINRVGEGNEDLTTATDAEVIAAIHGISLITPTKPFVGRGYWYLFQRIFPRQAKVLAGDMEIFEMPKWDYDKEQVFDFIGGLRKKLTVKDRALSDSERRTYQYSLNLQKFYFNNRELAPAGFFRSEEAEHYQKVMEVAA